MVKKVAVILAGCGYLDGAEVHEATMSLLALSQAGAMVRCFAPNVPQMHVMNHITGDEMLGESRNVMIESARICRGQIEDLADFDADDFDALVIPGGFGVAKNLCDFAVKGGEMTIFPDVERVVMAMHGASKPVGALCISPVIVAKLIKGARVTVGGESDVSRVVVDIFGGAHEETSHGDIVVDGDNKIVTTPCYMLEPTIAQVYEGARNLVAAVLKMA
jgi:enhancing lycopene biosynthesis protein 2